MEGSGGLGGQLDEDERVKLLLGGADVPEVRQFTGGKA